MPKGLIDRTVKALTDEAGNQQAEITKEFTTGPAALPVIRINKQTGNDSNQPLQTGVKMSCESYNATIYYSTNGGAPSIFYSSAITIGQNNNEPETIQLQAKASRSSGPALNESMVTKEIAYKTRVQASSTHRYVRGSDSDGGPFITPQIFYGTLT